MQKSQNFELKIAELEELSSKLENDKTPLSESLDIIAQAAKLSKECHQILDKTKGKVSILLDQITAKTEDFDVTCE